MGIEADPRLRSRSKRVEALRANGRVVDKNERVAVAKRVARRRVRTDVGGQRRSVLAVLKEEDLAVALGGAAGGVEGGGLGGGGEPRLEPVQEGVGLACGVGGDVEVDHYDGVGALEALGGGEGGLDLGCWFWGVFVLVDAPVGERQRETYSRAE